MDEPDSALRKTGLALTEARLRQKLQGKGLELVEFEFARDERPNDWRKQFIAKWIAEERAQIAASIDDDSKKAEREARMERSNIESLAIARSAKNAAWAAAIAAIIAIAVAVIVPFLVK